MTSLTEEWVPGQTAARSDVERFERLRDAVLARRVVLAALGEARIMLWPYAVGWRGGEAHVLGIMVRSDPSGKRPPLRLHWLRVSDLADLQITGAYWISAEVDFERMLRFLDRIDAMNPFLVEEAQSLRRPA